MSIGERWFPGHLVEISPQECLELLMGRQVGRVAYCDDGVPVVVPVNYVVDGQGVLLRLSPQTTLARALDGRRAAFEVDEVDEYTQSGWSVLLRGTARYVDPEDHPANEDLLPWPNGHRTLLVHLAADAITGRRLLEA